jgi:hypothetical protein
LSLEQHVVEIQHRGLQELLAAEREELAYEDRRSVTGPPDFRNVLTPGISAIEGCLQKLGR